MKKTFVCAAVLGALLTAGPFAYAQQAAAKQQNQNQQKKVDPKKVQESIASKMMGELDRLYSLTPEQKKKIDPIVQDEAQKLTKIYIDKSLKRAEMYKKRKTINEETMAKIKQHLTPDQIKKTTFRKGVKPEMLNKSQ